MRSRRLAVVLATGAIAVVGLGIATVLSPVLRQRDAVERLRALGAVVTYDFELPPEWREAGSFHKLARKLDGVTDRGDRPDPDHDGRVWLRRVSPDLFHDVVSVDLGSYVAEGKDRRDTAGDWHESLALVAGFRQLRQLLLH